MREHMRSVSAATWYGGVKSLAVRSAGVTVAPQKIETAPWTAQLPAGCRRYRSCTTRSRPSEWYPPPVAFLASCTGSGGK